MINNGTSVTGHSDGRRVVMMGLEEVEERFKSSAKDRFWHSG